MIVKPLRSLRSIRLLTVMALLLTLASCQKVQQAPGNSSDHTPPENLSAHPRYIDYDFGSSDNVIDLGCQPMWMPVSTIVETMKRDLVLKEYLDENGYELRVHGFFKGADINYFLDRGDLEVGVGGDMPALSAAVNQDISVAGMIQHGFVSIVAREMMLLADLKGKKIGYPYGSMAHLKRHTHPRCQRRGLENGSFRVNHGQFQVQIEDVACS